MRWTLLFIFICVFAWRAPAVDAATNSYSLGYTPAPPGNPLKGFMPYAGSYTSFPYSMEWGYLPLRALMTGPTNFDWSSLDALLSTDALRGHQTVFRVYLDYPTQPTGIPQYLLDAGLITYGYNDYDNDGVSLCPDYENSRLDQAMTNFIAALGARYDGDPRIGFVELGLLGYWGEWHTYPETNWFASISVQNEVLTAYTNAFRKTGLLVRGPAGNLNPGSLPIGYHDDSFAYDTIAPPIYNFLGELASADETKKWETQPIGGEVRPEVQLCMWDTDQTDCVPSGQEYTNCVALSHASWMLDQGVFDPGFSGEQKSLALAGSQQLGYELYVTNANLADALVSGPLNVSIRILNTGVAPFYYNWPVQLATVNGSNSLVQTWPTAWTLRSVLPGTNMVWNFSKSGHGLAAGQYTLLMRVLNPLTNGVSLQFANQTQNSVLAGWLTLGQFSVFPDISRPVLGGIHSPRGFVLQVDGATPGSWTIQDTSDLYAWNTLFYTNTSQSQWTFTDGVSSTARFYRIVSQP